MSEIFEEKPTGDELREEFQSARMYREIKRELERVGMDIPLETVKAVVKEYERLSGDDESDDDSEGLGRS